MLQKNYNSNVFLLLIVLSLPQLSFQEMPAEAQDEAQQDAVVTVGDIQRLGEANMDDAARSYISDGAGSKQTLRENIEAFKRYRFRRRALVDVSQMNTTTTVLGQRISFPVGLSPSAAHMLVHRDGEFATAEAARDAGTVMIVSSMSTASLEDIRNSVPDALLWQQTYIFKNRSLTESIVSRATRNNFRAIVVTVDSPVSGTTEGKGDDALTLPKGTRFANLEVSWPSRTFTFDSASEDYMGSLMSPSATWEDFRRLRSITELPLVAKGILTAESALVAYENGASAVLVSNHGGRQLDGDFATIEALQEVVAAVGDRMEVYMDGGIRSGSDVVKALSLGARAVFIGRPVLWGLAYNGKQGVTKALDILRSEFIHTIQLLGVPHVTGLCTDLVVHESYYYQPLYINCARCNDGCNGSRVTLRSVAEELKGT